MKPQLKFAIACEIIKKTLAHIGIVALVDEVTGAQDFRTRHALNELLEKLIAKELNRWAKMFPDEFYQEMFRLREWNYNPYSVQRSGFVGKLTNDLVYERLAPGVLDELRKRTQQPQKVTGKTGTING